jgi:hypothetical protein
MLHSLRKSAIDALISLAIFVTAVGALVPLVSRQPFGHDEAVYLAEARSWSEGTPANQWGIYRPIGMSALGWTMLQISDDERTVRLAGAVLGALALVATFLFFRSLGNRWIGVATATVVGASPLFLREASQFFNDVPTAGLLIAVMWLIHIYYLRAGRDASIYLAAPLGAAAFYLRYGAIMPLAILAIVTYLILIPRLVARENDEPVNFKRLGKTILLFILLMIPHFLHSIIGTGNFLGILTLGSDAAGRAYLGQGLVTYIQWIPGNLGGWFLEMAATMTMLFVRTFRERYPALVWCGIVGIGTFIVTGLLVHAEARYVIFPLILLAGTGITMLSIIAAAWSRVGAGALMAVLIIAAPAYGITQHREIQSFFADREDSLLAHAYSDAHAAVLEDARGTPCVIWEAQFLPRAVWYTACNAYRIDDMQKFVRDRDANPGAALYSLVYTKLREPQLSAETAPQFNVTLAEIFHARDLPGEMIVYRVQLNATSATTTATSSPAH